MSVKDSPGNYFTDKHAARMMGWGFAVNLHNQLNHSYIGVVNQGNLIYEDLSIGVEAVQLVMKHHGVPLVVTSRSQKAGSLSEIQINGCEYSVNRRGINIVVYDTLSCTLIDSVSFDTHVSAITCTRYADVMDAHLSTLAAIHAAGYSIPQYCLDNGHENIIIFTESQYWNIAEPIALSFRNAKNIEVKAKVSEKPFKENYLDHWSLGAFVTKQFDLHDISADDTVIVIKPFADKTVEDQIHRSGATVLQFPSLVTKALHYATVIRPVYDFMARHPNVSVVTFRQPVFPKANRSEWELYLLQNKVTHSQMLNKISNGFVPPWAQALGYGKEDMTTLVSPPPAYAPKHGFRVFPDVESAHLNISNNQRLTIGNPKQPDRTIYCAGGCGVFGMYAPDASTISSQIQRLINESGNPDNIAVMNCGTFNYGRRDDLMGILASLPIRSGDMVLFSVSSPIPNLPHIDCSQVLQRPHDYGEVYADIDHHNENAYRATAERLFSELKKNDFFKESPPALIAPTTPPPMFGIFGATREIGLLDSGSGYAEELRDYKEKLSQVHRGIFGRVGSIVMNCNPFTLGHRYLIEQAAAQVARLYVFAVEEDKSIFPFADRLALIKAGTADLSNVTVLPSGKFIISSLTFTDYFNKEALQDQAIDPTMDVSLFAKEIAPTMNITVRFAGEEPLDKVTKQYNDTMRRILPQFGVEFVEIPRVEFAGQVISASRVRRLLADKDFEGISKIVPPTTLNYLVRRFADPS